MFEILSENFEPYGTHSHVNIELKVAMDEKFRPQIPSHWQDNDIMQECAYLMQLCWSADVDERPAFSDVKKTLHNMIQKNA